MGKGGYIAIDRGLFAHGFFAKSEFSEREAWIWLIAEAAWKPTRVFVGRAAIDLKRGELAHSLRYIAREWGWSDSRVRRFLQRLTDEAMIAVSATREATQVTICNYDEYQAQRRSDDMSDDAPTSASPTQDRRIEPVTTTLERPRDGAEIQIPPGDGMWSRAHYDAFDAAVFEACGAAARRPGGSLDNTAPLRALLDQGCDFRDDIVGTIRAKCQPMAPGSLRSWAFLGEAIIEARDRRRRMSSMAQEGRPPPQSSRQKPIDWSRVIELSEA